MKIRYFILDIIFVNWVSHFWIILGYWLEMIWSAFLTGTRLEKFAKRSSTWKAKAIYFSGRLTIAKWVFWSFPSYFLLMFCEPSTILKLLERMRREFFLTGQMEGRWRWSNGPQPCRLELRGFRYWNQEGNVYIVLGKWRWLFNSNHNTMWTRLICNICIPEWGNGSRKVDMTRTGNWFNRRECYLTM